MNDLANTDRHLIRDSSAVVTVHAIDRLAEIAQETRQYLDADDREAITGALLEIEEQVDNIRAAIRLCRIAGRD